MGGGSVVRWWWRWRVNRSAGLSTGCGRLFFHSCKVDTATLKGRTERVCYGLLIGPNPNISTTIRRSECVPAETELAIKHPPNYGPERSSWRS